MVTEEGRFLFQSRVTIVIERFLVVPSYLYRMEKIGCCKSGTDGRQIRPGAIAFLRSGRCCGRCDRHLDPVHPASRDFFPKTCRLITRPRPRLEILFFFFFLNSHSSWIGGRQVRDSAGPSCRSTTCTRAPLDVRLLYPDDAYRPKRQLSTATSSESLRFLNTLLYRVKYAGIILIPLSEKNYVILYSLC